MSIREGSRNQLTATIQVVDATGKLRRPEFVDLRERVTERSAEDSEVVVTDGFRWSNEAVTQLKKADHWWAGADLSNVVDPFEGLPSGSTVRWPSLPRLLFEVLSPQNRRT